MEITWDDDGDDVKYDETETELSVWLKNIPKGRKAEEEFVIVEKEPNRKDVLDRKLRREETM